MLYYSPTTSTDIDQRKVVSTLLVYVIFVFLLILYITYDIPFTVTNMST